MFQPTNVRTTIDALHAHIAILDQAGSIVEVNDSWRSFGAQRNAASDYVGLNYLQICSDADRRGDSGAKRVEDGLRRLLDCRAESYGIVYPCAERTFRMTARRVSHPSGGIVVVHQDITALLKARRERNWTRRELDDLRRTHLDRVESAYEELGQRLGAISLAAGALERGGDDGDATTLIRVAVEEARQVVRVLRSIARQS